MPEWTGVAAPRAAAFIFHDSCQGHGCGKVAALRTFYVCKRYCCACAPTHLLDWNSVAERWPQVHWELFDQLPWTCQRASDEKGGVEEGRFVLKEDVEHLQARIGQVGVEDKARITLLKRELRKAQKDSQKIAQRMKMWTQDYEGRVFHVRNQRFTQFLQGLKKRWGWDLDELPPVKASPRFISLLIFVQSAPDLDYKVWNRAEVVIKSILEEDARMPVRSTSRPWSLSIPRSLAF